MIVYCGKCGALLSGAGLLCPACGVDQTTGPNEMTESENWYYLQEREPDAPWANHENHEHDQEPNTSQRGPYPFSVILSELHTGHITDATLVWYPEMSEWRPASEALSRYMDMKH